MNLFLDSTPLINGLPYPMPVRVTSSPHWQYGTAEISVQQLVSQSHCFLFDVCLIIGKWQIIGTIFVAEIASEVKKPHYFNGGELPTMVFPPIDFSGVKPETLKVKRDRELNNGRLAMISIMAFIAEYSIPGAVPPISGIAPFH